MKVTSSVACLEWVLGIIEHYICEIAKHIYKLQFETMLAKKN